MKKGSGKFGSGNRLLRRFSAACFLCSILLFFFITSCNPFSPLIDANIHQKGVSADSVNGFFELFREAYQFKDTTVYGKLLAPDFTFSYRNYDRGLDLDWGRDEEMQTTASLFSSTE